MTVLEQLVQQQVHASVVTTVSRTVDKVAEKMAEELLRDPAFRARMQELLRRAFERTLTELGDDVSS